MAEQNIPRFRFVLHRGSLKLKFIILVTVVVATLTLFVLQKSIVLSRNQLADLRSRAIALEQENKELQAKLDELNEKLDAASQAEEDAAAAENEMIKSLRTELDRTKEAYEALLEAKSCDTREGNVTFSRAMQTLERLKDYLGPTALEEYQTLGGE